MGDQVPGRARGRNRRARPGPHRHGAAARR